MGVPSVDTGIADAGGVTPTDAGDDASPRDAGDDAGPRDAGDDMGPRDAGDDAPDPCLGLPDADDDETRVTGLERTQTCGEVGATSKILRDWDRPFSGG